MKRMARFQQTLASQSSFAKYGRKSKRELFLDQMNQVVPWAELRALVDPVYPKAGNGRQPIGLSIMLRTYFLQQWFGFSDPGMEEAFYDSPVLQRFAGVDLGIAAAPDETTILRFRHLLEEHDLCGQMLDTVNHYLETKGIGTGTIVDATIIHAPSSTKNKAGQRDPEMHQTKKGNQWCVSRTRVQARDAVLKMGDGLPSRLAGAGFKPPGAAAFKRRGGERPRKRHRQRCQVSIEEMSESKPSDDASLLPQNAVRTGDDHWLQDKSGRHQFTVPTAVGV